MFQTLLPRRLDNEYAGRTLALWLYALAVLIQSVAIIIAGKSTAMNADGIPL